MLKHARLGDPHLGRVFKTGVPLSLRGHRENLVRLEFERRLKPEGASVHICMGDLFDAPQVPYDTLAFATVAYTDAARANPGTVFYVIQGNHDDSRDLGEVTAWDIFQRLMEPITNVVCVTEPIVGDEFAIFPWDPLQPAVEMVREAAYLIKTKGTKVAYGHWDTDLRTAGHNLIPTAELAEAGIEAAYTGHVHLPNEFVRDGVRVVQVGSMQPYAQGEDGGQSHIRYVTLTADDELLYTAGALKDCCVRVILKPGETWEGPIPECLSWSPERVGANPLAEAVPEDATMEGFDVHAVLKARLDDYDIRQDIRKKIEDKWLATSSSEG